MTDLRWSPAAAVWQIAYGTPGTEKTKSAIGWLDAQIREDRQETDYAARDIAARLLTALAEVREMPADLDAALKAATGAADDYAEGVAELAKGAGREKYAEQAIDTATDAMAAGISAIRAAMPAGWQG
jgi:hypothetical protein